MRINKIKYKFVEKIPHELEDGILYICLNYNVIVHNCACGCKQRTVTPINRENGWRLEYDGETVSLKPSIGNFNINCKSHYFITRNKVEWLPDNVKEKNKVGIKSLLRKIKRIFS